MDKTNTIISSSEYSPEMVPIEITPADSCEYFLIENYKKSFNNEIHIERQLFSKNDTSIYYFVLGENNILNKTYSTILWNN